MSETRDRYLQLVISTTLNGIDFVELKSVNATTLYVHFINAVPVTSADIAATITGGDRIPTIAVHPIKPADWSEDTAGRPLLKLTVAAPGDFSTYTLTLHHGHLDLSYRSASFSFKALCPSDFDCIAIPPTCPEETPPLPAIDYLAKDFQSFKLALTDFSAQRYPTWKERSEADFGVMFMETLCAVADELSYLQDRVAAEATLLNATQRRSLVSMARLVDYEPQPAISAATTIQCNVTGTKVPAGTRIDAKASDGSSIPFEIGTGLADTTVYPVSTDWNFGQISPYWLDDTARCLPCGTTSMYVLGHGHNFPARPPVTTPPTPIAPPVPFLIQTDLPGESLREIVHITLAHETLDHIFTTGGQPTKITHITWAASDALKYEHDLTATHLAGNLLPATQGQRYSESFSIAPTAQGYPVAIARRGPNSSDSQPNWIFRYPLSQGRLTWLASTDTDPETAAPAPELTLTRRLPEPAPFTFFSSLLRAGIIDPAYTVDPEAWRVVARDGTGSPIQWEYDSDQGDTIRLGDGTFGAAPGELDVYDVTYRIGLGSLGNVAPNAVNSIAPASRAFLLSASNPFIVTSGSDPETTQHIQRMAPQAFRAIQYRAVRPEDYEAAAETLPWVLKAGTAFRWTGSWLSVFTTSDPKGNETMSEAQHLQLIDLLNRRRLAGYESFAPTPNLIAIDLRIAVCIGSGWLSGDVEAGVLQLLANSKSGATSGFFFADRFTFGTPLYRSRLEAAIQAAPGVRGVLDIEYRMSAKSNTFGPLPEVLPLATDQILRIDNDPSYPERGTIRVDAEGGQ